MHQLASNVRALKKETSPRKPSCDLLEDEVDEMAYYLWESAGHPIGGEAERLMEARKRVALTHARDEALEESD